MFAKQPSAKLLFIGTKADLVNEYTIQDIKDDDDLSDCVNIWCNNYRKGIDNRQSLLSANGTRRNDLQLLQIQLSGVEDAVNKKWVISSSKYGNLLKKACAKIQFQIRDNNLGFNMPDSYTAVLDYLYQL